MVDPPGKPFPLTRTFTSRSYQGCLLRARGPNARRIEALWRLAISTALPGPGVFRFERKAPQGSDWSPQVRLHRGTAVVHHDGGRLPPTGQPLHLLPPADRPAGDAALFLSQGRGHQAFDVVTVIAQRRCRKALQEPSDSNRRRSSEATPDKTASRTLSTNLRRRRMKARRTKGNPWSHSARRRSASPSFSADLLRTRRNLFERDNPVACRELDTVLDVARAIVG